MSRLPENSIVVSDCTVESEDWYDIIQSNVSFINAMRDGGFNIRRLHPDAVRCYFVDFYDAQMRNGGFAQFVYNSHWNDIVIDAVRTGIAMMGGRRHTAVFDEGAALVQRLGASRLNEFLASDFISRSEDRACLNVIRNRFWDVEDAQALGLINSEWLASHPDLWALGTTEMENVLRQWLRS